jgi:hypothetical protein
MSQRRSGGPAAAPTRRGGPAEKAAPKAPVLTPQIIGGFFAAVAIIGAIVVYSTVIKAGQDKVAGLKSQLSTVQGNITTYKTKGQKLKTATELDKALKDKLSRLDYLFLADQNDVVPYYEDTLLTLLDQSNLEATNDSKILGDVYTFQINMLNQPFNTIPNSPYFKNSYELFKISYLSEQNGVPPAVLDTRPADFLTPYTVTITGWRGTYRDVMDFIDHLQRKTVDKLITVHCLKNDDSKNGGFFRTNTEWTIKTTVYFMNPEKPATGDEPPMKPGGQTC